MRVWVFRIIIRLYDSVKYSHLGAFGVHVGLHQHISKIPPARDEVVRPNTQVITGCLEYPVMSLPKFEYFFCVDIWSTEVGIDGVHLAVASNLFLNVW